MSVRLTQSLPQSDRALPEWCPVCHTYHHDVGEKTDAGRLTRPCPLLPAGVGANHPINAEPLR